MRPSAITAVDSALGGAGGAPAGTGVGPAPGSATGTRPAPLFYPSIRLAPRQRTLAEIANEQLGLKRREKLAGAMEDAATPDCLAPASGKVTVGGVLTLPIIAANAVQGKCK